MIKFLYSFEGKDAEDTGLLEAQAWKEPACRGITEE